MSKVAGITHYKERVERRKVNRTKLDDLTDRKFSKFFFFESLFPTITQSSSEDNGEMMIDQ